MQFPQIPELARQPDLAEFDLQHVNGELSHRLAAFSADFRIKLGSITGQLRER